MTFDQIIDKLPAVNAILNSIAGTLLVIGYLLIRRKKYTAHGYVMGTAFAVSSVFLVSYLTHKAFRPNLEISSRFPALPDWMKYGYWFVVLLPHLILAVAMLPFILKGLWHAYKREWEKHRRVQKISIVMWLYVSITGVLIYWLLYHYFPAVNSANLGNG